MGLGCLQFSLSACADLATVRTVIALNNLTASLGLDSWGTAPLAMCNALGRNGNVSNVGQPEACKQNP